MKDRVQYTLQEDVSIFYLSLFMISHVLQELLCSDGRLEVVVPSFVHNIDVLDGSDGEKLAGISHL
jgi:hypothetical protein